MAKTTFISLTKSDQENINICIRHNNTRALLSTGVKVPIGCWDGMRVSGANAALKNTALINTLNAVDRVIDTMLAEGELRDATATDIKNRYLLSVGKAQKTKKKITFEERFIQYMNRLKPGTRHTYDFTLKHLRAYCPEFSSLTCEDITKSWLQDYIASQNLSRNSVNIQLRNIRAVFNEAVDDEITTNYPFRKLKIKSQATKDRSLSPDDLRKIFTTKWEPWQQPYVDMFKLMFYLCGINAGDLAELTNISNDRIEYNRKKTGKHYSIGVQPEALEIIKKYKGKKHLVNILDKYKSYLDYLHHMNDALKTLGLIYINGRKPEGEALWPELSSYYARYSWATTAALLDIPKETIAAALGHTQMDVTAIYIRTDYRKKIDEANRKVIDFILYGNE